MSSGSMSAYFEAILTRPRANEEAVEGDPETPETGQVDIPMGEDFVIWTWPWSFIRLPRSCFLGSAAPCLLQRNMQQGPSGSRDNATSSIASAVSGILYGGLAGPGMAFDLIRRAADADTGISEANQGRCSWARTRRGSVQAVRPRRQQRYVRSDWDCQWQDHVGKS